jgi:hypothetical protein
MTLLAEQFRVRAVSEVARSVLSCMESRLRKLDVQVFKLMHVSASLEPDPDGTFDLPIALCGVFSSAMEFALGVGTKSRKEPVFLAPDLLAALEDGVDAHPANLRAVHVALGFAATYRSWVTGVRDEDRSRKQDRRQGDHGIRRVPFADSDAPQPPHPAAIEEPE